MRYRMGETYELDCSQEKGRERMSDPTPRPELMLFAIALEKQMRYNEKRGKGDEWKEADLSFLWVRFRDEAKELKDELFPNGIPFDQKKIRHESLDVGCMAFFIFYRSLLITAEGIAPRCDER